MFFSNRSEYTRQKKKTKLDIKHFYVWKANCFSKPSFLWWQMKVELTIPIILVVTITVKQPAASVQAPRWHLYLYSLLDVEFGACLIPCSTTSCASIATIKGGVDAAVDLYSRWTAKAWQTATSRLHDESAENRMLRPVTPVTAESFPDIASDLTTHHR